jgi:hypothetical protein
MRIHVKYTLYDNSYCTEYYTKTEYIKKDRKYLPQIIISGKTNNCIPSSRTVCRVSRAETGLSIIFEKLMQVVGVLPGKENLGFIRLPQSQNNCFYFIYVL